MHAQAPLSDLFIILGSVSYTIQFIIVTAMLLFDHHFSNKRQYLIAIVPWFILLIPAIYFKLKSLPD